MTAPDVIVFDVDGVLVDVTASYREAIRETVRSFTGVAVSNELIQQFKNQGGWNNDWELSFKLVTDAGVAVTYPQVVDEFNRIFFGNDGDGLIQREIWLPGEELFGHLQRDSSLAIFTGRVRYELTPTLRRFAPGLVFDPAITADDVLNPKPAPDGLRLIQQQHVGKSIWYLGDTVDDARAAKSAGVPFIGVAGTENPQPHELARILKEEGAFHVIAHVNELMDLR